MGARIRHLICGLIVLLLLGACAEPARVSGMVPAPQGGDSFALRGTIGVTMVDGGRKTVPFLNPEVGNEEFAAALKQALLESGFWTDDPGRARFALHASLERDDRPIRGLVKVVRSIVRYRLQDLRAGDIVYDAEIESRHGVTFEQTPIASDRHRRANEGAIRKNIATLLARLRTLEPGGKNLSALR